MTIPKYYGHFKKIYVFISLEDGSEYMRLLSRDTINV